MTAKQARQRLEHLRAQLDKRCPEWRGEFDLVDLASRWPSESPTQIARRVDGHYAQKSWNKFWGRA